MSKSMLRTVREVIDKYLELGLDEVCPEMQEIRRKRFPLFVAEFGDQLLSECRAVDILTHLKNHPEWASEHTRRSVVTSIKRAFNFCWDHDLIDANPYSRFKNKGELPNHRKPMPDNYYQSLLRYSPPFWRRFMTFIRFSGCRPGEAAAMRWKNVRLEDSCVILHKHKTSGKTGKPRLLPLIPVTVKLLLYLRVRRQSTTIGLLHRLLSNGPMKGVEVARFLSHYGVSDRAGYKARKRLGVIREFVETRPGSGYYTYRLPDDIGPPPADPGDEDLVFQTCLNYPINKCNVSCWMSRTRKRAGLPGGFSLYNLRHRFASQGAKNNVNLKLLSLALGHADCRTTEVYLNEESLSESVKDAALSIVYGPERAKAMRLLAAPAIEQIPVTVEQLPTRYGVELPRPLVHRQLADVPLPKPGIEPGQQSLETMMREMMAKVSVRRRSYQPKPTSRKEDVSPAAGSAYEAMQWAKEQEPSLDEAKDRDIHNWLKKRADCPHKTPYLFATFKRYVAAARLYHDTRKRVLEPREPVEPMTSL
jgi:integrase